jgi:hypothetical protein
VWSICALPTNIIITCKTISCVNGLAYLVAMVGMKYIKVYDIETKNTAKVRKEHFN